jgi:hypothetical protein
MTLAEIAKIITDKNYVFQVAIPGQNFLHGKTTVNSALSNSESVESYLKKIADNNKTNHLYIKLFTPNGSSFKARGEHLIFLDKHQPVATNTTTVATTPKQFSGIEFKNIESETPIKKQTMNDKDYIDFKVLEVKHETLQSSFIELQEKNKKLEKKVDELHDENKNLLRDNLTKEDKHALEIERAKLNFEKEGKEGLSGLIGDLTKDPETLKMIVGFINPKHPMFNQEEPKQIESQSFGSVKYTDDNDTNQVLNDIPLSLSQKDGKTIAEIYLIVKELLNDSIKLEQAVKTFLPQQ